MIANGAMNIYIWITNDGRAYFVLREQSDVQAVRLLLLLYQSSFD